MKTRLTLLLVLVFLGGITFAQVDIASKVTTNTSSITKEVVKSTKDEILSEDFEGQAIPTGWTLVQVNTSQTWEVSEDGTTGNFFLDCKYDASLVDQNELLYTTAIDLAGYGNAQITFDWQASYYYGVTADNYDMSIEVSTDGGTNFTQVWVEDDYGVFNNWEWINTVVDLSAYDGQEIIIGFRYVGNDGAQAVFDNVLVEADVAVAGETVTLNVDMTDAIVLVGTADEFPFDPATHIVEVAGDFNNWGDPVADVLTDAGDGIYSVELLIPEGEINFKFRLQNSTSASDWAEWAGDPNRAYTVVAGTNVYNAIWGDITNNVNELFGSEINMYPNPVASTVYLTNVETANISIYNILGVVVRTVTNSDANASIDMAGLASGTYIVKVQINSNVFTTKLNVE